MLARYRSWLQRWSLRGFVAAVVLIACTAGPYVEGRYGLFGAGLGEGNLILRFYAPDIADPEMIEVAVFANTPFDRSHASGQIGSTYWGENEWGRSRYVYGRVRAFRVVVGLQCLIGCPIIWLLARCIPARHPGHCRDCDYNLHGIESERCPECGATIEHDV